ncbi:MAG: LPS export ABC transporter ATP-binding protein, partial [Sodaliphilus sp.]|nr:LPS export ABC transporter ATP-binding protein [Sodaliphilus sp.]
MKFPWNKTSKPATAPTADTSAEQQNAPQLDAATTENAEAGKPATPKRNSKDIVAELNRAGEAGELVLSTDNLVKKYRQRVVANHVSINVRQGEIVGLLGPNGAGKTTTFYMTTGLVTPNEGRVFLNDVEITKLPVYKRAKLGIGYLPQEASVFRTLTVEDNLRLVLEMTNTTPEYQRDKLESLLDEFHLQKVRKNLGNRLSGGERRRCEIARCLAINPKFIMLDEPFAGVDPIAVEDIQSIVYKLKEKNIGIL